MKLKYLPALDGLRAFSILLVVLFHWPYHFLNAKFGWVCVNFFFVLSGLLITNILLQQKNEPLKPYLYRFYKSRTLRIFPLYYAYLALLLFVLIGVPFFLPNLIPDKYVIKDFATINFDL